MLSFLFTLAVLLSCSVSIMTRMTVVRFTAGAGFFCYSVQTGFEVHSLLSNGYKGLKRTECEADHSPPSSVEVQNAWSYTSTAHTSSWRGACLSTGTTLPSRHGLGFYLERGNDSLQPHFSQSSCHSTLQIIHI
jgi:hypothetical protein